MKFKIGFFIITTITIIQLFWFLRESGNTIIYVQNHSPLNRGVDCSIIYEEEILGKLTFDGEEVVPVKKYLFSGLGVKNLIIKSDKLDIVKKKTFISLPVKWIVVNFYENDIFIETKYIPPLFYFVLIPK